MPARHLPATYRPSLPVTTAAVVFFGLCLAAGLLFLLPAEEEPLLAKVAVIGGSAGFVAVAVTAYWLHVTRVERGGVTARSLVRARRLPWCEIQGFRVEPVPGGRARGVPSALLFAIDSAGETVFLPNLERRAGLGWRRSTVAVEASWLRQLWEEHRGPDWRVIPAATERVERPAVGSDETVRWFGRWFRAAALAGVGVFLVQCGVLLAWVVTGAAPFAAFLRQLDFRGGWLVLPLAVAVTVGVVGTYASRPRPGGRSGAD